MLALLYLIVVVLAGSSLGETTFLAKDNLLCDDRNATYKECPNACPGTCENPTAGHTCKRNCQDYGCECSPGYFLNDCGKCVLIQDCPESQYCSDNETYVYCNVGCPTSYCPTDDSRGIIACDPPYPCPPGCACKSNYLRLSYDDQQCVLATDCPPVECNRQNEVWDSCPSTCLQERCEDVYNPQDCDKSYSYCRPACVCEQGFYRDQSDICVPVEDCDYVRCNGDPNAIYKSYPNPCEPTCDQPKSISPCTQACIEEGCECKPGFFKNDDGLCVEFQDCPASQYCSDNETYVYCNVRCPTSYCPTDDSRGIIACDLPYPCPPGCACKSNYLRLSYDDQQCVLATDCPPVECTRQNEVWDSRPSFCLQDRCEDLYNPQDCNESYSYRRPACVCEQGFYINQWDICVPPEDCACDVPRDQRSTCAVPNPPGSPKTRPTSNQDGCQCQKGYILSNADGKCIKIEECPQDQGCNRDPNAIVKECPWTCSAACAFPNASQCNKNCRVGCECKSGYIYSNTRKQCVLPDTCEGGNPCGANATFSECSFRCPNMYCPQDDSNSIILCKPGRPCPPGCICKPYHLRVSYEDDTCVLASDCPEVTCTKSNEVWDSCSSECLAERCEDITSLSDECYPDPDNCVPRCVCVEGFFRNSDGSCIPAQECPKQCNVPAECRPTCAVPKRPDCPYVKPSPVNVDGCNCADNYILTKPGGKCIRIEDCPKNEGCNGDPNAQVQQYPLPCPSTCSSPDATPCKKASDPIGCACKSGYMLSSENGRCILPEQCKGGNPCGPNSRFVDCKYECPTNYCPVDDSRGVIACGTVPTAFCLSGCACDLNHKILSYENRTCVVSSDCPPVECTRRHELWDGCPSECLSEYCDAVDSPPVVCNTFVLNCQPKCVCKKNYFRNSSDLCVSAYECRKLNANKPNNGYN